ncbi:MAG: aminomethyltransferase [Cyanobacteriota bacterium]|jgi:folate-binding protein YgfZ
MESTPQPSASQPTPWPLSAPEAPWRHEQAATLLRLDGPDSLRFLHGQSSQDLQLARPGQWRRSCCLSPTARVTALVDVLADANGAWLVISAGDGALVRQQLDRVLFPADQVTLGLAEPVRLIETGPAAAATSTATAGAGAGASAAVDQDLWQPLDAAGSQGFRLGPSRWVLRADTALPPELVDIPALTAEAAEAWRIHQGQAAAPAELNGDTNPFELGLASRVSLNKGCYVGQETLARLVTYDGIKQQLRRWHWRGPAEQAERWLELVQPGQLLSTPAGERAGRITTLLRLKAAPPVGPETGEHQAETVLLIGLALVRRTALEAPVLLPATAAEGSAPDGSAPQLQLSVPEAFSLPGD